APRNARLPALAAQQWRILRPPARTATPDRHRSTRTNWQPAAANAKRVAPVASLDAQAHDTRVADPRALLVQRAMFLPVPLNAPGPTEFRWPRSPIHHQAAAANYLLSPAPPAPD